MIEDYGTYTKTMGVLDVPAGYDVHRQIETNALTRQLGFYWWVLALVVLLLVGLGALIWRVVGGRPA